MHPLDNPAWHALVGPHHTVAERHGSAARYHTDVTPFAAISDGAGAVAWNDLRDLVGPGGAAVLFRGTIPAAARWERLAEWPAVQMIAPRAKTHLPGSPPSDPVTDLGQDDVDDMLDLVARTDPGPFARRTIQLGPYIGVRHQGQLVAMAGVRMRLPGHAEISAVCTDADHRGRGLGALLVRTLTQRIESWGETAFLHATRNNVNAIRLYEAMGFTLRRTMDVALLRTPA
jgi:ribosomal protein S18 acetylase RimI-like enzyme